MEDLDGKLGGRVGRELVVRPQVDDRLDAVVDERRPALVAQLADAVGADDRVVPRLAAVLGRMAAEVADVEQPVPEEVATTLQRLPARRLEASSTLRLRSRTSTRLPGAPSPGEIDGRVAARAAAQHRGVRPARAFDEHLLDAPDSLAVPLVRDALDDVDEPLDALLLDISGTWAGQCRFRPLPRRVDEREGAVVADLLDDLERLLEVALGLAREADDDVRRQREIGDRRAELVDEAQVALAAVRAAHRLEDAGRARLQRQVRVLADGVALRHRRDHVGGSPSDAGS